MYNTQCFLDISPNLSLQEHIPELQLQVYPCPPLSSFSSESHLCPLDHLTAEWPMLRERNGERRWGEVQSEIGEIRDGMGTITSAVMGLKGALEAHTEKMTEALTLVMRIVTSVEQKNSQTQQIVPPGPSGKIRFPAPGNPSSQKAPVNPTATPSKKRKEITTKPTASVSVKKTIQKQAVKKAEEPTPSVPKKVKTDRLVQVPWKPGSQKQN